VGQSSAQALYRCFFLPKRSFTVDEITYFVNVDFVGHVALVAALEDAGESVIIGGCRYIVTESGKAEAAFRVVDRYQGQGVGTTLLHHLAAIARAAGLKELTAEVLMDNIAMLRTFEKSGLRLSTTRGAGVVHVTLGLC
jgi:GNAT superfamily N-acetyltransferase